jgi:hypothetical protein
MRPRHVGILIGASLLVLGALAAPVRAAAPAAGATIDGPCSVTATSLTAAGAQLDTLQGPATSDPANPFDVDPKGQVAWSGSGPAITTGTYQLTIYGIPIWSGTIANQDGKTSADGTLNLGDILPAGLVGVIQVGGSVSGDGGSCSGSVWIRISGDPLTSIPGLAGIGLAVLGLLGVATAVPGAHPFRGLLAGLLLGIGAGVIAIVFGIVPMGALTPFVAIGGGGVIGLILGLLPVGGGAA